jgi:hypothetical protein
MVCKECGMEIIVANPPNAVDAATLHLFGYCSDPCAALYALSRIWALDKSRLLPLLARVDESPSKLRFRLEDVLEGLTKAHRPPDLPPSNLVRRLRPAEGGPPRLPHKRAAAALGKFSARYQRLYDDLNADGFDGALPQCTVVVRSWTDFLLEARRRGSLRLQAYCKPSFKRIEISDALAGRWHGQVERVLLHEICHFRVLGHGDDFQAELRRMATQARHSWVARWVEEEVIRCARLES